jgi:hypothetical protein
MRQRRRSGRSCRAPRCTPSSTTTWRSDPACVKRRCDCHVSLNRHDPCLRQVLKPVDSMVLLICNLAATAGHPGSGSASYNNVKQDNDIAEDPSDPMARDWYTTVQSAIPSQESGIKRVK